jgi:rhamnogalacturonyl hydrolase YesR
MKNAINRYVSIAIIFLFGCTIAPGVYAQTNTKAKKNPPRSALDLMNLITNQQLNAIALKDGDYVKGNWQEVKKSKLPIAMYWSYPTGVTLLGMQRVYNITRDEKIMDFVNKNNRISAEQYAYLRWQKNKFGAVHDTKGFEKLWRLDMLDDCGAMGAAILESSLRNRVEFTPALKELVEITGNFVANVQYRTKEGTFYRPNSPEGPTIWADDLYMSLPFLIRWAEYKKDESSLNDAAQQIIDYAAYLQDSDGLLFHAYFVDKKVPACCKWGRANGWAAVAIAEVLSVLPEFHPHYKAVLNIYRKHIEGIVKYQSASGLWNQVIDHPELSWGIETSSSAQYTYAMARGINKGWLNKSYLPVVKKAFAGLEQQVNANGSIARVCMSTSIGDNLDYYNTRSSNDHDYHGAGLMLLALTEVHSLLENQTMKGK